MEAEGSRPGRSFNLETRVTLIDWRPRNLFSIRPNVGPIP